MFNWKTKEEKEFEARWAELKGDREIIIANSPGPYSFVAREHFDGYSIRVEAEDIEGIILELDKQKEIYEKDKKEMEDLKELKNDLEIYREIKDNSTKNYRLSKIENFPTTIKCTYENLDGSGIYTLYYENMKDVVEYITVASKTIGTIKIIKTNPIE